MGAGYDRPESPKQSRNPDRYETFLPSIQKDMADRSDVPFPEGVFPSLKGAFGRLLSKIPAFVFCSHLKLYQVRPRLSIQPPISEPSRGMFSSEPVPIMLPVLFPRERRAPCRPGSRPCPPLRNGNGSPRYDRPWMGSAGGQT